MSIKLYTIRAPAGLVVLNCTIHSATPTCFHHAGLPGGVSTTLLVRSWQYCYLVLRTDIHHCKTFL